MYRIFFLTVALGLMAVGFACGGGTAPAGSSGDSPTEAYKRLYAAVKSKDTEAIKAQMTAKSHDFAKMASERNNTPIEKVFENGFTATTFAEKLPEIRDQRIKDQYGSVEVWNSKDSRWEDLPFINDNGTWKFAIGELFAGSFVSPGKGRDMLEKEAANAANGGPVAAAPTNTITVNTNGVVPIVPKPAPSVKAK
jgi:hypothetical protein